MSHGPVAPRTSDQRSRTRKPQKSRHERRNKSLVFTTGNASNIESHCQLPRLGWYWKHHLPRFDASHRPVDQPNPVPIHSSLSFLGSEPTTGPRDALELLESGQELSILLMQLLVRCLFEKEKPRWWSCIEIEQAACEASSKRN